MPVVKLRGGGDSGEEPGEGSVALESSTVEQVVVGDESVDPVVTVESLAASGAGGGSEGAPPPKRTRATARKAGPGRSSLGSGSGSARTNDEVIVDTKGL